MGIFQVNRTLKQLQGQIWSLFPWMGSVSRAQLPQAAQAQRAERWELGFEACPRIGLCSMPGTEFIIGCCCVQQRDKSQLLLHKTCRRLKTEMLKAVHKKELNPYCLPLPLFDDSQLKCSALGLAWCSSGTLMAPVQCGE